MLRKARFKSRVNAFRHMGSWHLLALAFALCTSLAVAQEGQQVPKTTVQKAAVGAATTPGAAPAGPPAAGVETAQGKGSAWVKLCSKNEQTGNKQLCLVKYEGLDPNTGITQIAVAARSVEGEDKQTLLFGVTTAYSLVIPAGVQIKIDDNQPIPLKYNVCISPSCQAQTELTKEIFDKMRNGKQMIVAAMNMQQKAMAFPVPLTGFSKTFDGPPADNAKYEEAQRQMMETIRQRQIDLANKVADQKKVQGAEQPQAGAPPQAGAQVPTQPPR
jgi:invasion protein IalB